MRPTSTSAIVLFLENLVRKDVVQIGTIESVVQDPLYAGPVVAEHGRSPLRVSIPDDHLVVETFVSGREPGRVTDTPPGLPVVTVVLSGTDVDASYRQSGPSVRLCLKSGDVVGRQRLAVKEEVDNTMS